MNREQMEAKLLDYALGEVTEAERAEIERALAGDAGLRAKLEELKETVALISAAKEGAPVKLSAVRRDALLNEAARAAIGRPAGRLVRILWPATVAAAALLGIIGGVKWVEGQAVRVVDEANNRNTASRDSRKEVAKEDFEKLKNDYVALVAEQQKLQKLTADSPVMDPNMGGAPHTVMLLEEKLRKAIPGERGYLADRLGVRDGRFREDLRREGQFAGPDLELAIGDEEQFSTEEYNRIVDNPFVTVVDGPLSTFSIDVDTASYANVRRYLTGNSLPPPDAVRIEELVNYFSYKYAQPQGDVPFSVQMEQHACPWNPKHKLVRIGLQGREIKMERAPASNLVFLIDVSGSMNEPAKLPLVKESLRLLVENLRETDKVAIVVYAGSAGLVLPSTPGTSRAQIQSAIDNLNAGGSTAGGQGIELAYKVAQENFVKDGVNRVMLLTDGDFNVGVSDQGGLVRLIEEKRKTGVFLSVLGFGTGNYADARMQELADRGNGNASYIDSIAEGKKVLVEQASGTLITIAKDVKIQVEFNPGKVAGYRLIGYENRMLAAQDFNDDTKDAGEIGAGHQVTALYEVVPAGAAEGASAVDPLKYQRPAENTAAAQLNELLTVKLRYKKPDGEVSEKVEHVLEDAAAQGAASTEFDFAASVAAFGMILRNSEYKGQATLELVEELAKGGLGEDEKGYRKEFVEMVKKARELSARPK